MRALVSSLGYALFGRSLYFRCLLLLIVFARKTLTLVIFKAANELQMQFLGCMKPDQILII